MLWCFWGFGFIGGRRARLPSILGESNDNQLAMHFGGRPWQNCAMTTILTTANASKTTREDMTTKNGGRQPGVGNAMEKEGRMQI
jgi:hypothetical protein